jgi:hypothetical protein
LSKYLTQTLMAHCSALIGQQVTASGDAEWPTPCSRPDGGIKKTLLFWDQDTVATHHGFFSLARSYSTLNVALSLGLIW